MNISLCLVILFRTMKIYYFVISVENLLSQFYTFGLITFADCQSEQLLLKSIAKKIVKNI